MKSGFRTSEFWLSLAAVIVGAFLASGIFPSDHWAVKVAGIAAIGLGAMGYSVSRGLTKGAGYLLVGGVLALGAGCQALGQTPTATGATGVGQYGALSGLQAGSTMLSMSGSVSVQVQPGQGGALMPEAIRGLLSKLAAETDAILADPTVPPEAKKGLVEKQVEMISRLSAPWGAVTVSVQGITTGESTATGTTGSGTGGGSGDLAKEPEKPEGPRTPQEPEAATPEESPAESEPPASAPAPSEEAPADAATAEGP